MKEEKHMYLAHISEDKKRMQSIFEHQTNTAKLAAGFASAFHHEEWGYCAGMLHDIGKYSDKFQERIRGKEILVDHATAGARVCWERGGFYPLLSYCIAGHHAGLPDTGEASDTADQGTWMGRRKKQIEDFRGFQNEIAIPPLSAPRITLGNEKDSYDFILGFFIRMVYSCLVDADFLDTEAFMKDGRRERDSGESMERLLEKLKTHVAPWLENQNPDSINGRRTEILKHCFEAGSGEKGIYRLTVPTGGGKTLSSLAFALSHANAHKMDRVIYVLPYTSIIEQNAAVFGGILGRNNVLEDHCNVDYEGSEELHALHLAAENWDKPVVVTTNVQFFESLFASKSSKCRKLHNIANSVVIFDEVQMLPTGYLKPCMAAMKELVRNYACTLVLCTATQPALEDLFPEMGAAVELCPRMEAQFEFFRRVRIKKLGKLEEEQLADLLEREFQALCIVNTKKNAQSLYARLKGDGVYHLSTAMYPAHRKAVLAEIKKRLKDGEKCLVIATSLVEAGVDLDFQAVYRQQAGIDSVIQAAGRCNREGKRRLEESITYIFSMDSSRVPGQELQIETARQIMERYEDVSSSEAVHAYFQYLYHHTGSGLDKKKIMSQFHDKRFPFCTVSHQFRLIEENTVTVLIPKEAEAKQLLTELEQMGISRKRMREAGRYSVNLYENSFQEFYGAGMLREVCAETGGSFWVLKDGNAYSDDMGLVLNVERGGAIFL